MAQDEPRLDDGDDNGRPIHLVREAIQSDEGRALHAEIKRLGTTMVRGLHEVAGTVGRMMGSLAETRTELRDLRGEVDQLSTALIPAPDLHRPKLPSLTEYNPDLTPAGGIRVEAQAWEALQRRIAMQEDVARAARAAADLAAAEQAGAAKALVALEAKSKRFRDWVLFGLAVGTPILTAIAWAITHFAHL